MICMFIVYIEPIPPCTLSFGNMRVFVHDIASFLSPPTENLLVTEHPTPPPPTPLAVPAGATRETSVLFTEIKT